jgi:DNA-binding NarL/FixJ family response regulator
MSDRRLILVTGEDELEAAAAELERAGWLVQRGFDLLARSWEVSEERRACVGRVDRKTAAASALVAAARGASVVASLEGAPLDVAAQFVEDLTRLGPIERRRVPPPDPLATLNAEQRRLLELLAEGHSLGDAALRLHVSRRTADRRLAAARRALGVRTTAEALLLVGRRAGP